MPIDLTLDGIKLLIGGLFGGGVAWGTTKVTLHNKVGYREHTEMCGVVKKAMYDKMDMNHSKILDLMMEIKSDIGELKGEIKNRS